MNRVVLLSAAAVLALSLASCQQAAAPVEGNAAAPAAEASAADADTVKKAFADFNAAIAAKNLDGIKVHYASDAIMIIPDQPPFEGVDAIMADYKAYAADAAGKYAPGAETTAISSGGDLAFGEVKYQSTFTNPKTKAVETVDRYNISLFKKQPDGSWKVVRDVNTSLPKAS